MIPTNIRLKNIDLEKQQKLQSTYNSFYASKLQDYVEKGLFFSEYTQTKKSPMLTQITYF